MAEVLASAIGANVTDIKVVRQSVANSAGVRQAATSRAASPATRAALTTLVGDSTARDALRLSPARPVLPSPSSSASRPPGYEASPVTSSAPQTPPFLTDACRTPCSTAVEDVVSPTIETAVVITSSRAPTPVPPYEEVVPQVLEPMFQRQQEALLPSPAWTPPRPPAARRKTLAGVTIDRSGCGLLIKRSSTRLSAKARARAPPVALQAEALICRNLGIIKDGRDITAAALDALKNLFKEEISDSTMVALRKLFKLDDQEAEAIEDALVSHGGEHALDHEEAEQHAAS